MEFGNAIRSRFMDEEFVRSLPNDQEFGKEVRKIIKNI
jgi:AAA+ superfamily predicted ATPase